MPPVGTPVEERPVTDSGNPEPARDESTEGSPTAADVLSAFPMPGEKWATYAQRYNQQRYNNAGSWVGVMARSCLPACNFPAAVKWRNPDRRNDRDLWTCPECFADWRVNRIVNEWYRV